MIRVLGPEVSIADVVREAQRHGGEVSVVPAGSTKAESIDLFAEVLDFPDHPFYVVSMFQPHIGALAGAPVHPLVREFVAAVRDTAPRA